MQFQVPQFIEVEDKIFGPLTFKQFVYVAGGGGLAYMLWRVLPIYIGGPLAVSALGLGASLAFLHWNGRPFIVGLENAFYFFTRSKLYLWDNQKKSKKSQKKEAAPTQTNEPYVPHLSDSRLHELAWSLDIKERIAAGIATDKEREDYTPENDVVAPIKTARSALPR